MRHALIGAVSVLLAATASAQQTGSPFELANPITLRGAVTGLSSWSGVHGPESFLIFEVPNAVGSPEPWAASVATTMRIQRGEAVEVTGYAPAKSAAPADLIPFGAVPMLTSIARARRVLRATKIVRADGTELVAPAVQTQGATAPAPISLETSSSARHRFIGTPGGRRTTLRTSRGASRSTRWSRHVVRRFLASLPRSTGNCIRRAPRSR